MEDRGGWRVWFKPRRPRGEPWSVVAEAATEREALLLSFRVRADGDLPGRLKPLASGVDR